MSLQTVKALKISNLKTLIIAVIGQLLVSFCLSFFKACHQKPRYACVDTCQ